MPRIGLDFDNTIVCYDSLFSQAARDRDLIGDDGPQDKESIRNHLRDLGREEAWTELQAYVYGQYISTAPPFPGAIDFIHDCQSHGIDVVIISHKTERPYRGPPFELRTAAMKWMRDQQIYDAAGAGLSKDHVFFEPTKQAKLSRIATTGCQIFVDDLLEFLVEPEFPHGVERLLFDPNSRATGLSEITACNSWLAIRQFVFEWLEKN